MKKRSFFLAAITTLLLCQFTPLWTQGEPISLEEIWRREDIKLQLNTVCKPARLAICSKRTKSGTFPSTYYLIDLRTGEEIYQTDPNTQRSFFVNYMGDKFYIYDIAEEKWKEYDTKTKEYIQEAYGYDPLNFSFKYSSPDNCYVFFDRLRHTFLFTDINTGIVKDSFQIEGKQHDPQSLISYGREFTPDGRYFNFSSHWSLDNNGPIFFQIYDRQTREIIFKRETPAGSNFRYQYFNTSNKIAFAEEVKLTGDDKVYSYIRIFDPDTRTIVKDIKLSEFENDGFRIDLSDKFIVYQLGDLNNPNIKKLYNLETDKFINFDFRTGGGTGLVLVDLPYIYSYGSGLAAEIIDMSVGVVEKMKNEIIQIYPNPTNGIVSLNISPEYLMGKWNVSDLQGRILKKGLIGHASVLEINIADLVPGTYYVTVIGTDNKHSYKIIKM